jgi:UDP-N-acetylmuramoylalanine--D-glutamate ligase
MGGEVTVSTFEFEGAQTLILGGGVTGAAVSRVLRSRGADVSIVDEKETSLLENSGFISMESAANREWSYAVVSPGWRLDHPFINALRAKDVPLVSEIDLAWQVRTEVAPGQRWLGVTGTNGKTTTVEMATAMLNAGGLRAAACGNVGDTVIEAVVGPEQFDYLVIELSSFQLQWSNLPEFLSCAVLNIAEDHMDWHGSSAEYISAKLRILKHSDLAILNGDDGVVVSATQHWRGRKVFFSLDTPSEGELGLVENLLVDRAFVADPMEASLIAQLDDVHPSVPHNVSNALAAAGLARSVGVPHEVIRLALQVFRPGRHRIETVIQSHGIRWINDSKATNPHAATASIMSHHSVIWIAGGLAKGAHMNDLIARTKGRIKAAILIGEDRELIATQLNLQTPELKLTRGDADSVGIDSLMELVVLAAQGLAVTGDTVLLAPACASMDQFISYADRGDQFVAAVNKLVQL